MYFPLEERTTAFIRLGNVIEDRWLNPKDSGIELSNILAACIQENPWFDRFSVLKALTEIRTWLYQKNITHWLSREDIQEPVYPKKVGIIAAGNLPMVGFHDLLTVLISGHFARIKLSSKDSVLIPLSLQMLVEIEERFTERLEYCSEIHGVDALIATGSDVAIRQISSEFNTLPKLLRNNRSSMAVLTRTPRIECLKGLGADAWNYYGLGCRNISKIFLPTGVDPALLLQMTAPISLTENRAYLHNLIYQRNILRMKGIDYLDAGQFLLLPGKDLFSPISTVFYHIYHDLKEVLTYIEDHQKQIQCILSDDKEISSIPPGKAQSPELWDYADGANTMQFLHAFV